MKAKKSLSGEKKTGGPPVRRQENAYGGETTICMNGGCLLRKKAKCFGFEGCPGFKGK
ncbi:MAG: hypothetical protein M0Z67_07065 [Nitrospiraceae bacterium]|nr:hypothetical protein [Nitrospiraceae bacterium]